MGNRVEYKVLYMEDFFTLVHETVIVCLPAEIKIKVDEYYEENLSHDANIVGANWSEIDG